MTPWKGCESRNREPGDLPRTTIVRRAGCPGGGLLAAALPPLPRDVRHLSTQTERTMLFDSGLVRNDIGENEAVALYRVTGGHGDGRMEHRPCSHHGVKLPVFSTRVYPENFAGTRRQTHDRQSFLAICADQDSSLEQQIHC